MEEKKKVKDNKIKKLGNALFAKFFGFEEGIDITDDVAVLNRRNVVIKNIIFISGLFYSLLLLILSISTKQRTDWAITVISFPVTYLINKLLKALINMDRKDKTKQLIAAYIASFYIFLSSVLIYARLYSSGIFETVSYILIYYAIVVISLYQDKKLLSTAFSYLFVLVTVIHFTWTYQITTRTQGLSVLDFLKDFVGTNEFGDLILRSLVFALFYLVVYVIVSIGQYMQEERKKELIKRRQVQKDFSSIVGNLFQAVFINAYINVNQEHAYQVQKVSEKIASFVGMNEADIKNLSEYAIIHYRYSEIKDFDISATTYDEAEYEQLKAKTTLGADIVKRMELSQNCEAIVRSHVENTISDEKMRAIMNTQPDLQSQIILLADIYVTLRSFNTYKRPYTHAMSISLFEHQMSNYFRIELKDRFLKFADEVEELYNNF
ncbi:HD-GYP domain-containing protein [Haploplasma axanthum]|uniref:HD-GYP domain-containing protein n=1 Tax=Haploplasma axanthum TaxID=29552 RepID=A0A449BDI8_HAPAX|nr:hypothetical protein [Haploplasma axanthum]VEU80509.1 Uncharacterised protein [Haploplasma axanthum]